MILRIFCWFLDARILKKTIMKKSQHLKEYLNAVFEAGEKEPSKRKAPGEVSKELRQRKDMTEDDWLTETQVKDYFTQERARRRYGKKQVSAAEVEDTQNPSLQKVIQSWPIPSKRAWQMEYLLMMIHALSHQKE